MTKHENVLWISGIAWLQEDNTYFPEATYPGIVSGSAFQQAIIEGMESYNYKIKILSDCDMSSGERLEWSHNGESSDIRIAGKGNKILRIPTKIIGFYNELKKSNILNDMKFAIAYEMHLPYLFCLSIIKKINPKIKTVLICPDVSIYMDLNSNTNFIKKSLKKVEYFIEKRLLKSVDGFVLFTEQMLDFFDVYNKPYVVVEGVYRDKYSLNKTEKEPFFMHAGSLHKNIGIEQLIAAFENLQCSSELWFFGSGTMDEYIKQKSKINPKIKHMGFVDPSVLFEYEKKALALVNVRNPNEEYTKYSFPSKTFEYLASATPFLSTSLPGMPKEYLKYMITIDDNSIESIEQGLNKILSMSELDRENFGKNAQKFVITKKNKSIQSKKIIELLELINS